MSGRIKTLIERLYAEGINMHDAVAAAAFYSPDAKNHGRTVGREGMQITEHSAVRDDLGMCKQLGLVTPSLT